jgi:hypothetical protein
MSDRRQLLAQRRGMLLESLGSLVRGAALLADGRRISREAGRERPPAVVRHWWIATVPPEWL